MMIKFDNDFTMTIGGKSVSGEASFEVVNPATEQVVGFAPDCSAGELDQAVAAARAAFQGWSALPIADRQRLIVQMADLIEANIEALKFLLTSEQGKPLMDAATEVRGTAYWLRETATLSLPEIIGEDGPERRSITQHVPLGVVAAIPPWNYPLNLAAFKLAPALLAGNTVVLKPSPFTPLTTLKVGELLANVLPAGVLNVISGGDALGPRMTAHPGFDKISFTGSTPTGRKVMASAAATLKRVTLELGGNDAAIVLPGVDIQKTAQSLFWAAFANSGQICLATKRIYIHRDVYEPIKAAMVAIAQSTVVGNGAHQGTQLGPISNRPQYDRVVDLIRDSKSQGYVFATGDVPEKTTGYFVSPTIIDNPPESARIVQEEQFGPIIPLLMFDDVETAIAQVNASEFGLGASIWSPDIEAALAIAKRIQSGTVWINETMHLSPLVAFAGHKQSGIGCEGGQEGLLEYTAPQTITVKREAAFT